MEGERAAHHHHRLTHFEVGGVGDYRRGNLDFIFELQDGDVAESVCPGDTRRPDLPVGENKVYLGQVGHYVLGGDRVALVVIDKSGTDRLCPVADTYRRLVEYFKSEVRVQHRPG